MKKYSVVLLSSAEKALKRLDKPVQEKILKWLRETLEGCENPRWKGTNLINHPKGNWRYRVGDYRIFAQIQDDKVVILIVDVKKRNDAYKK